MELIVAPSARINVTSRLRRLRTGIGGLVGLIVTQLYCSAFGELLLLLIIIRLRRITRRLRRLVSAVVAVYCLLNTV